MDKPLREKNKQCTHRAIYKNGTRLRNLLPCVDCPPYRSPVLPHIIRPNPPAAFQGLLERPDWLLFVLRSEGFGC